MLRDKCLRVVSELSGHSQWKELHVSVRVAIIAREVSIGSGRVCVASEHG